ncbi:hypothetical protein AUJ68_03375 [Candidatus Woesearchaeota archaeon CG1_02_57_44]|nr:MAG: hypothetical protein AUJ68_03375 [Candidatus Woesearchaeota archaeon CG1_02_57_44]
MYTKNIILPALLSGEVQKFHRDLVVALAPTTEECCEYRTTFRTGVRDDAVTMSPVSLRYSLQGRVANALGSCDYQARHQSPWLLAGAGTLLVAMVPLLSAQPDVSSGAGVFAGVVGTAAIGSEAMRYLRGQYPEVRLMELAVSAPTKDALEQLLCPLSYVFEEYQNPAIRV